MTRSVLVGLLVGLSSPVVAQSPNDTILPTGKRVEVTVASGAGRSGTSFAAFRPLSGH